jgi:hypothetical protein
MRVDMNKKNLVFIVGLCIDLSACVGDNGNEDNAKSAFINTCIIHESSTRPAEQAKSYCNCAADAVFSNKNISNETKSLMSTMNDQGSKLYQQKDAAMIRGPLMSCYTAKFYKK